MKRYLAFYGAVYYPTGGMHDIVGDYDTKEQAVKEVNKLHEKESDDMKWEWMWASIYDTKTKNEVWSK